VIRGRRNRPPSAVEVLAAGAIATAGATCPGHHAHGGEVVRCELAIGHPVPHAREIGLRGAETNPEVVTWAHDRGRRAAEAAALRWKRDRLASSPAVVVVLAVLVGERAA
jgi:hypothetical protein